MSIQDKQQIEVLAYREPPPAMSPSLTYNIVVTKDPLVTQRLFFDKLGRTSLLDLYANLTDSQRKDALIVSPMRNDNFISFDIDFPKSQGQRYAVLKLLETKELLEYFQVSRNGLEEFVKLRAKIEKSLKGNAGLIDFAKDIKPSFYVAFGMGDDVSQWSGPYVVELIDANITSTSDNVRELEVMFSPTVEGQSVFTNKVFDDNEYAKIRSVFDAPSSDDQAAVFRSARVFERRRVGNRRVLGEISRKESIWEGGGNGTNFAIRKTVRQFLADRFNVPFGNALFLTDADWGYLDKRNPDEAYYQGMLNGYGIQVDTPLAESTKEEVDEKFANLEKTKNKMEAQIARSNEAIKKLKKQVNKATYSLIAEGDVVIKYLAGGDPLVSVGSNTERLIKDNYGLMPDGTDLGNKYLNYGRGVVDVVKRRSDYINNLSNYTTYSSRSERTRFLDEVKSLKKKIKSIENKIEVGKQALSNEENNVFSEKETLTKYREKYKNNQDYQSGRKPRIRSKVRFSMTAAVRPSESHDAQMNVLRPLYTMINEIKKGKEEVGTTNDFTLVEENDYRVLKSLKDSGLIDNADTPVIIFGNERIIQSLIYPEVLVNSRANFKTDLVYYEMAEIGKEVSLQGNLPDSVYKGVTNPTGGMSRLQATRAKRLDIKPLPNLKEVEGGYTSTADDMVEARRLIDAQWKEYYMAFIDLARTTINRRTSSFGEIPNFYAYGNETRVELNKLTSPLIFLSNVTNANVQSLSFDSSPYKAVLLNSGHDSGYTLLQEILDTSALVNDNSIFSPDLLELINALEQGVESSKKEKSPGFLKSITEGDTRKLILGLVTDVVTSEEGTTGTLNSLGGNSIRSLLDFVLLKQGTPPTFTKTVAPGRAGSNDAETIRNMSKYIINVNLKTLPFFNTMAAPGRDCYLFGLSNNVIGDSSLRDIPAPAFYTGAYTIISYKHSISHDGAFSEFELIPNAAGLGTISGDASLVEFFNFTQEEIDETAKERVRKKALEEQKEYDENEAYTRSSGGVDPAGG